MSITKLDNKTSMRKNYEEEGSEEYYKNHAKDYKNPHKKEVQELIKNNHEKFNCDKVLDLCAGNGEVSETLIELGYVNVNGCDPYTQENYIKATNKPCLKLTFDDIINKPLVNSYSSIICSFGLHLCEESKLHKLIENLLKSTETIVIITPHKRPNLNGIANLKLTHKDSVETDKGKKVFLKVYQQKFD